MEDKEILEHMSNMSIRLKKVGEAVNNNDWERVGKLLEEVRAMESLIRTNPVSVETRLKQNPGFKESYETLKESLLEKVDGTARVLEEWKVVNTEKISGSKDILKNISRYHKHSHTSYYIDKEE